MSFGSCSRSYSIRALAFLHSIELIQSLDKRQKVNRKPNRHPHVEYLMRMAPDVKEARFPRLRQSQLFHNMGYQHGPNFVI
jgi:hypothetical protein